MPDEDQVDERYPKRNDKLSTEVLVQTCHTIPGQRISLVLEDAIPRKSSS